MFELLRFGLGGGVWDLLGDCCNGGSVSRLGR